MFTSMSARNSVVETARPRGRIPHHSVAAASVEEWVNNPNNSE
jgi:hypothetical protein